MKTSRYRVARTSGVLASVVGLAMAFGVACGSDESGGGSSGGSTSIKMVVPQSIQYIPVFAAIDGGYFEKQGLDASVSEFTDVQAARTVFLSGDVDVLVGASIGNTALNDNVPIKHVVGLYTGDAQQIVLKKDLESKVEAGDVNALKGLTLATTTPGSGADTTLRALLSQNGITDAKVINNNGLAGAYSALSEGRVDGMITAEPFTTNAIEDGLGFQLMDLADAPDAWPVGQKLPSVVFSVKEDFYNDNRETVDKLVAGVVDALIDFQKDPAPLVAAAQKAMPDQDKDRTAEVVNKVLPRYSPIINEDGWDPAMDLWLETGALKNRVEYDQIVATDYEKEWARFTPNS